MKWLKKISVYTVSCALVLSGCVTNTGGSTGLEGLSIGPQISSIFDPKRDAVIDENKHKLDVIIPVFDPGLSEEAKDHKVEGVWPELRRAEANRFAYMLKKALDDTKAFGAVRVTPDKTATGDIYVMGKILQSNGEDVELEVEVYDIANRHWFTRIFDHEVDVGFHKNARNEGLDPYAPVFEKVANRVALELEDLEDEALVKISQMTELRFATNMSADAFAENLTVENGTATLVSYPSDEDPMLKRTRAIRVRDQLFVDGLQDQYRDFSDRMNTSYQIWQEQSLFEIEAEREANRKAAGQAALGVLAIGLAILSAAAGARSNTYSGQSSGSAGAILAGTAAAVMISKSFQTSEESKVHRDALNELGESIDVDLAPKVIEFEKETIKLTGSAKEQFAQWREFLKKIYEQERTPEKQL